jgi:hypothetical protein
MHETMGTWTTCVSVCINFENLNNPTSSLVGARASIPFEAREYIKSCKNLLKADRHLTSLQALCFQARDQALDARETE